MYSNLTIPSDNATDVELAAHSHGAETLYMAINGKVFDITNYVNKHPGVRN
jgi:cytochrome b involved in lipid metabolism